MDLGGTKNETDESEEEDEVDPSFSGTAQWPERVSSGMNTPSVMSAYILCNARRLHVVAKGASVGT